MMTFNDYVHKHELKNKATGNRKTYEAFKKIRLDSKVGICLRDGKFSLNYGILNLHPSKGTHWVGYIKGCYCDSYGCPPPKKTPEYKENKAQKKYLF